MKITLILKDKNLSRLKEVFDLDKNSLFHIYLDELPLEEEASFSFPEFIDFCKNHKRHMLGLTLVTHKKNTSIDPLLFDCLAVCNKIKDLRLLAFNIDDSVLENLNLYCPSLEVLQLYGSFISNLNFLKLPCLTKIDLSNTKHTVDIKWKNFASNHPKLKSLKIPRIFMSSDYLDAKTSGFLDALNIWDLSSLRIGLIPDFFKILPSLKNLQRLTILSNFMEISKVKQIKLFDLILESCPHLSVLQTLTYRFSRQGIVNQVEKWKGKISASLSSSSSSDSY